MYPNIVNVVYRAFKRLVFRIKTSESSGAQFLHMFQTGRSPVFVPKRKTHSKSAPKVVTPSSTTRFLLLCSKPMARLPRVVIVDVPHHVTQRGNARRVAGPFMVVDLPSKNGTLGAPSLRFLQGRERCCRYYRVVMSPRLQRFYGAHPLHFITCSCFRRRPLLRGLCVFWRRPAMGKHLAC